MEDFLFFFVILVHVLVLLFLLFLVIINYIFICFNYFITSTSAKLCESFSLLFQLMFVFK